ncbi:alpha/beta hydrolase [Colletotrichum truncatum]|uniref:Alpha/beta hydrolase n=1 Tax=Colletotrichum truncatum TaxID=5467 RepID=A0ACC3ZB73_COLTU|nr:alpha/beta hydrolase [Colletotrichum truncatum]KAF6787688.1 alpha/beta hydrolase [Colletotrichum truncatum]
MEQTPHVVPGSDADQLPQSRQRNLSYANDTSSEEFILSDGRKLGVAYYGARSGSAVFYLHGYPGCRLSGGVFFDAPGKKLGARIIAVDRPGIGNSSPQPGRALLDFPNDIRELAEHLNLQSYGIIGVSGGGPYALACAYSLPEENLKSVSVIGGVAPIDVGMKGMNWGNWLTFIGLLYFPIIIRWLQIRVVTILNSMPNEKLVELVLSGLAKKSSRWISPDLETLKDPEFLTMVLDLYREHYKQGVDGYMEDGRVLTSNWGFRLETIHPSIPVQLWYSKKDTNVPFRMGEAIASRLSSRPDFHVDEDETHLNLVLKYNADALERLVQNI